MAAECDSVAHGRHRRTDQAAQAASAAAVARLHPRCLHMAYTWEVLRVQMLVHSALDHAGIVAAHGQISALARWIAWIGTKRYPGVHLSE